MRAAEECPTIAPVNDNFRVRSRGQTTRHCDVFLRSIRYKKPFSSSPAFDGSEVQLLSCSKLVNPVREVRGSFQ